MVHFLRVKLNEDLTTQENLEEVFNLLAKKTKQLQVIMMFVQLAGFNKEGNINNEGIDKKILLSKDISTSSLKTLVDNGYLEEYEVIISRFKEQIVNEYTPTFTKNQHLRRKCS